MAIKVTLGEHSNKEAVKPFPKIMKSKISGKLFYFIDFGLGLPLEDSRPDDSHEKWVYGWLMEHFFDYNEPITIQNA